MIFDNASVGFDVSITAIEWSGVYLRGDEVPPAEDDFTIYIFEGDADRIGTTMQSLITSFAVGNAVNRTQTGFDLSGLAEIYNYRAEIYFDMTAHEHYWFGIQNSTLDDSDFWFYAGEFSPSFAGAWRGSLAVPRNSFYSNYAFDLRLYVPAPATCSALGLCGFGLGRRRRI